MTFDLDRVQNEPLHVAHHAARRQRIITNLFFIACILIVCFGALPFFYARIPLNIPMAAMLTGAPLAHILVNCLANALVCLGSVVHRSDRLDRKLAAVFSSTLVVHGAIALYILLARQPHSNLIMPAAVLVSLSGGALVMYAQHRRISPKIAVLGNLTPSLWDSLDFDYEAISDPQADLRTYDILLTTDVVDLSPEWAATVSRAMLAGKRVRHLQEFIEERRGLVSLAHFDIEHLPVGGLTSYRVRKRLLDIGLVLVTSPLTVPLMGLAMLLIGVTMGRPVLFVQERTGMGGKPFKMYKLRTMRPASIQSEARATTKGDTRITPLGGIFRRYRIDELPQLWNVLRGDMSVIGPRPEWTILSEQYTADLPVYAYRHLVRPGITGWAQVRGGYAGDLAETRVKVGYDLFYVKNQSFSMDIQILVRTVWTLLSGDGAR